MRRIFAIASISGALLAVSCGGPHDLATRPTGGTSDTSPASASSHGSGSSSKPDITQMSLTLLPPDEEFPQVSKPWWSKPEIEEPASDGTLGTLPSDPADCADWLVGPPHAENAVATKALTDLELPGPTYQVWVKQPAHEAPDWESLVEKCGTIAWDGHHYTYTRLTSNELPPWSVLTLVKLDDKYGLRIVGNYRGIVIDVTCSRAPALSSDVTGLKTEEIPKAAKLFNAQLAMLEAA